jgi:phytoene synthase
VIARRSRSNLAFALASLPKERRGDMITFYAFCRVLDDLVDEEGLSGTEKRLGLDRWRRVLSGAEQPGDGLETRMVEVRERYAVPEALFNLILEGMEMDLSVRRYPTFEALRAYCYRVAGAVGLVSIRIFGCQSPRSCEYAEQLGYALQMTNILRDVGEDAERGRIYLPLEDLERFGCPVECLLEKRVPEGRFRRLMEFEGSRTEGFFVAASQAFPAEDEPRLVAAETMRTIYGRLLEKMRRDGFRVLERRYRLGRLEKAAILARAYLRRSSSVHGFPG